MSDEESEQLIEQFGIAVLDFSSQYGSASGFSYTVRNIVGRPSSYPLYGDFSRTYAPVRMLQLFSTRKHLIIPPQFSTENIRKMVEIELRCFYSSVG